MRRMTISINEDSHLSEEENYKKIFWRGFLIWALATSFYFYENLLNIFPSAIKPELAEQLARSAADLGSLSACYLWAYGLMQIPAGILMDKVGPRKMLSLASFFCALGCFFFGLADTLFLAKIGRILIGIGASFAVVGCSKIASIWFAPNRFALFIGMMVTIGMLGPAVGFGPAISGLINISGGWREAIHVFGFLGVLLGFLLWLLIRDEPKKNVTQAKIELQEIGIKQGLLEVVSCSQAWLVAIYAGLMFVPTLAFGALWGKPFLVEAHGFSPDIAGYLVAQIFLGWVFGGPIYGWVSDHMGLRNPSMYVANVASLILCCIIIYSTGLSAFAMGLLLFLLGFFSSGFILAFAVTREKNRAEVAGSAIGFINTFNTFGGAIFQYMIGKLLDITAKDVVITGSGERIFSLADYQTALFSLIICLIISLIILFFVKETYCKPRNS